ncbi:hypothetical protein ACN9JG_06115 [Cereibacter azotoformans]|uniref:hypothetical protein n=1 Tax=Cereibacter azotoformans TaxID=43057 RepID=UPI003B210708
MKISTATITITGTSPLSQSRQHLEDRLEGEGWDAYDLRTWRQKLNVSPSTGTVVIPQHGMHQALIAGAKYTSKQIPGQGKKTWTAKFTTGIAILDEIDTGILPEDVGSIVISANADGVRGSGKRVPRKFPMIYDWSATFDVMILDPIITEAVFAEMMQVAGLFIGVGRFRPEKGGQNGRWRLDRLEWKDGIAAAA